MSRKMLDWYESLYMRALGYAVMYGCNLSVEQFAAAHGLEADELQELRTHLERLGVST